MRRLKPTEHQIQRAVFDWREAWLPQIPELALLHAIPNGAKLPYRNKSLPNGKVIRVSPEALKLKREGLTPGIPDCGWPVPRGPFHGLYIEHKATSRGPSPEQAKIIDALRAQGYAVHVSRSADSSIGIIRAYWALGPYRQPQGDAT